MRGATSSNRHTLMLSLWQLSVHVRGKRRTGVEDVRIVAHARGLFYMFLAADATGTEGPGRHETFINQVAHEHGQSQASGARALGLPSLAHGRSACRHSRTRRSTARCAIFWPVPLVIFF
jgi:hypothetical protein